MDWADIKFCVGADQRQSEDNYLKIATWLKKKHVDADDVQSFAAALAE